MITLSVGDSGFKGEMSLNIDSSHFTLALNRVSEGEQHNWTCNPAGGAPGSAALISDLSHFNKALPPAAVYKHETHRISKVCFRNNLYAS